jgi:thermostable 8-oxoguanine DNA glycosylase
MLFETKQIEIAKRLTLGAMIYRNLVLKDVIRYDQFKDGYKALVCFIQNYAYERQGAARAYPFIAKEALEKTFHGKITMVTVADAKKAWEIYTEIAKKDFNNLRLNESHNPMNPDKGVLSRLASQQISNIASYVKDLIEQGRTGEAYDFISSIRGVGSKIASFYLRDIAYLGNINENNIKDQFYLQPIDTWLEQTLSIIFKDKVPTREGEKQKIIVELCNKANCSPIAFNQGAWVLGSKIAKDFKTFRKFAEGEDVRSILIEHISRMHAYIDEVKKIVDKF